MERKEDARVKIHSRTLGWNQQWRGKKNSLFPISDINSLEARDRPESGKEMYTPSRPGMQMGDDIKRKDRTFDTKTRGRLPWILAQTETRAQSSEKTKIKSLQIERFSVRAGGSSRQSTEEPPPRFSRDLFAIKRCRRAFGVPTKEQVVS